MEMEKKAKILILKNSRQCPHNSGAICQLEKIYCPGNSMFPDRCPLPDAQGTDPGHLDADLIDPKPHRRWWLI